MNGLAFTNCSAQATERVAAPAAKSRTCLRRSFMVRLHDCPARWGWPNIAAGFGTSTHGPRRCCPRPVGQAHTANCPPVHVCRRVPSGGVALPLTLTKRIFPALASRRVLLLADRFGGLRLLARKKVPRFASALLGAAKTMKLRMAFLS